MRRNRTLPVVTVLLASALLAACGDDDADPSEAAAVPETAEVTVERSRFDPDELSVAPGTEVRWENVDPYAHTVTSAEGSAVAFDSGEMAEGDSFTQVFDEAGTYEYFCEVHPTMRSTVVVG